MSLFRYGLLEIVCPGRRLRIDVRVLVPKILGRVQDHNQLKKKHTSRYTPRLGNPQTFGSCACAHQCLCFSDHDELS